MLSATGIHVTIERKHLLRGVDLEVRPGEVVAVLGENGAGKSTLIRALAGDITPRGGVVNMNGRPLDHWRLRDRARVRAVMPQDHAVAFGFTALETVAFGRYPHAEGLPGATDHDIARAALRRMDALHLQDRLVTTLSGGERARVMLAKTLAQVWEPVPNAARYLLLDEPTASLDPAHQHSVLGAVRAFVVGQDVGVCAALHDLNLAAQYADRIMLLKGGYMLASGTPVEVLTTMRLSKCFGVDAIVMPHPRHTAPLVVITG